MSRRVDRTCFTLEGKIENKFKDSCHVTLNVFMHQTMSMVFVKSAICSETILKSTLQKNILLYPTNHAYVYSNKS